MLGNMNEYNCIFVYPLYIGLQKRCIAASSYSRWINVSLAPRISLIHLFFDFMHSRSFYYKFRTSLWKVFLE